MATTPQLLEYCPTAVKLETQNPLAQPTQPTGHMTASNSKSGDPPAKTIPGAGVGVTTTSSGDKVPTSFPIVEVPIFSASSKFSTPTDTTARELRSGDLVVLNKLKIGNDTFKLGGVVSLPGGGTALLTEIRVHIKSMRVEIIIFVGSGEEGILQTVFLHSSRSHPKKPSATRSESS